MNINRLKILGSLTQTLVCSLLLLLSWGNVLAQNRTNSVIIKRQQFGNQWPFTVDSGELKCINYGQTTAVFFKVGTKSYGLNGIAQSRLNLPQPYPIWRDNPEIPGTKINIGSLISKGLDMCKG